jgi:hypothetical protein
MRYSVVVFVMSMLFVPAVKFCGPVHVLMSATSPSRLSRYQT